MLWHFPSTEVELKVEGEDKTTFEISTEFKGKATDETTFEFELVLQLVALPVGPFENKGIAQGFDR
jgi:hypothetical protein